MGQTDFSKLEQMNIHSDVIFANQADRTEKQVLEFEGHTAQIITTDTRGVGKNRNIALTYASADICMLADDDVKYADDMEERIMREFKEHPDADIIIFHLATNDPLRKQKQYKTTRKCSPWERMPWGTFRAAFRLESVRKANVWFSTLFGGGCIFPSGEDSMWFTDAKRAGLTFYVSKETIGTVCFDTSTWFTGHDEKYFFARGAFYQAARPKLFYLWCLYFSLRVRRSELPWKEKIKWLLYGKDGYKKMLSFDAYRAEKGIT